MKNGNQNQNSEERMRRTDWLRKGYTIDSTIYPNVAYVGPRFMPDHWVQVPTELEEVLMDELEAMSKIDALEERRKRFEELRKKNG